MKTKIISIACLVLLYSPIFAQYITGKVLSSVDNRPLAGVSVNVRNTGVGTITDTSGFFSIRAAHNQLLVITNVGYQEKIVAVSSNYMEIVLETRFDDMNEVVVLAYSNTQKRSQTTAAISTIKGERILEAPVANITNSLIGKVSGVFAQQKTGRPGDSGAEINIRGRSSENSDALIVVDGIERNDFGDIDPNEIESITILKDAAQTALYGIKGANGVVIVTTKTGKQGRTKVNYTGNFGINSYTSLPQFLGAYESAMLHNEGELNLIEYGLAPAGFTRLFSDEDLQIYKDGTGDPLLYPDVNWYKALTNKYWVKTQHNVNFSGGTSKASYFISLGYLFEDGMFKNFTSPYGYKTNPSYTRYNIRTNVDYNITKSTKLGLKIGSIVEKRYCPTGTATAADLGNRFGGSLLSIIGRIAAIPAWGIPFFPEYTDRSTPEEELLDNTYNQIENQGRVGVNTFNPYAVLMRRGYMNLDNDVIQTVFTIDQNLNAITKGLKFRGMLGYNFEVEGSRAQTGTYAAYEVDPVTKELIPQVGKYDDPLSAVVAQRDGRLSQNIVLSLNYDRVFGRHSVSGNLIAQREFTAAAPPFASQGIVSALNYIYDNRYFLSGNLTYNGSENYAAGRRYGLFPAISAGWMISNEKFLKETECINVLKLRGSYGFVGYGKPSGGGRFLYLDEYSRGGGAPGAAFTGGISNPNSQVHFGNPTGTNYQTVVWHSRSGNLDITFEKSVKRNIGLDAAFLKQKIKLTADVFDETRYDILLPRNQSALAIYGEAFPYSNYGKNYNKGYELSLDLNNNYREFNYGINFQLTHAENKRMIVDEPPNQPANLSSVGRPIGQNTGFRVLGFYTSLEDIANSPFNTLGAVIPGDLKFADISGPGGIPDGQIDMMDMTAIGYSDIPENVFGIEPHFSYKRLSLTILFQGANHVSNNTVFNGGGLNQYYPQMLNYWTPDNPNASWPAMKPGSYSVNVSYIDNSFMLQNAAYVKLRNVMLSYNLGNKYLKRIGISNVTLNLSGQNLYTRTKMMGLDPENNLSKSYGIQSFLQNSFASYPVTKVYNIGLNVQF